VSFFDADMNNEIYKKAKLCKANFGEGQIKSIPRDVERTHGYQTQRTRMGIIEYNHSDKKSKCTTRLKCRWRQRRGVNTKL
jgi:hypothetical protein